MANFDFLSPRPDHDSNSTFNHEYRQLIRSVSSKGCFIFFIVRSELRTQKPAVNSINYALGKVTVCVANGLMVIATNERRWSGAAADFALRIRMEQCAEK